MCKNSKTSLNSYSTGYVMNISGWYLYIISTIYNQVDTSK